MPRSTGDLANLCGHTYPVYVHGVLAAKIVVLCDWQELFLKAESRFIGKGREFLGIALTGIPAIDASVGGMNVRGESSTREKPSIPSAAWNMHGISMGHGQSSHLNDTKLM